MKGVLYYKIPPQQLLINKVYFYSMDFSMMNALSEIDAIFVKYALRIFNSLSPTPAV